MEHKSFKHALSDQEEFEETNMNGEQQVKRLKKEVDEVGEDCFVYKVNQTLISMFGCLESVGNGREIEFYNNGFL